MCVCVLIAAANCHFQQTTLSSMIFKKMLAKFKKVYFDWWILNFSGLNSHRFKIKKFTGTNSLHNVMSCEI